MLTRLQKHHPEFLIRTYLCYEILEAAIEYAVAMIKKVGSFLPSSTYADL